MKIVLVQPPFFRLVGSHNDKCPIELSYIRAFLEQEGPHSVELYNGDFTGARGYWSWRKLFENFEVFKTAVTTENSTVYEVAEQILTLRPDIVIISAGDTFIPAVILGNPYVSTALAKVIKANSDAHVVGVGTFFGLDKQFDDAFDLVVTGGPNTKMARHIVKKEKDVLIVVSMIQL